MLLAMVSLRDEEYRRVLQNNEKNITNSTNLSCLLPVLRAKGLLTENEFRLLQEMPEYEVRRRSQLVQTLQSKGGGNALNLFIEALQEETEHLGHKNLAITLLGEISSIKHAKKPAPPAPPRKARASFSQSPQPFSTPQPVRRHMTLHVPPTKERPQSATEMDNEKIRLPVGTKPLQFFARAWRYLIRARVTPIPLRVISESSAGLQLPKNHTLWDYSPAGVSKSYIW